MRGVSASVVEQSNGRKLAIALEKLKQLASECAECDGNGKVLLDIPGSPIKGERVCGQCADIRFVIARCES